MSWGLTDVTKRYGDTVALDHVGIDMEPGAISVVVGGDGAGKSTLLKVCTGLVAPDRGSVRRPEPMRIGVVTETAGVYNDLTVEEHLGFTADAYGLDRHERDRRGEELLGRADLAAARGRLGGNLSGGMRQKLALILALLHAPDLLVLDEPTTGVDPASRAEVWRLVGHATAEGTAVLLATTYLDEAERATEVLVLHEGRVLLQGVPEELTGDRRLEDLVIERQRAAEGSSES